MLPKCWSSPRPIPPIRTGRPCRGRAATTRDRRPLQRAAGAYVVLVDGVAALYLERGGSTLQTLAPADDPDVALVAAAALRELVLDGRLKELVVKRVDGEDVGGSPFRERLLAAGFAPGLPRTGPALHPLTER